MIFRFVVCRLYWLRRVPFLPQFFDAFLLAITALTNREKLRAIETLETRVCATFGATTATHRFGGTEFVRDGVELGHVHGNGLFDAMIGRANRIAAVGSGLAMPHHIFPDSGWVSLWLSGEEDVGRALELVRLAADRQEHRANVLTTASDRL